MITRCFMSRGASTLVEAWEERGLGGGGRSGMIPWIDCFYGMQILVRLRMIGSINSSPLRLQNYFFSSP